MVVSSTMPRYPSLRFNAWLGIVACRRNCALLADILHANAPRDNTCLDFDQFIANSPRIRPAFPAHRSISD
ncbi:hypothetical protein BTO02_31645 [Paraburkholderia sp. SOS3]|nr:hypothetical protein BTO02_31645 [Paraburkholderia sp. SOS3]